MGQIDRQGHQFKKRILITSMPSHSRSSKIKLIFTLPNLEGGGTHKVMLTLLKHLDRSRFDISLITAMKNGHFSDQAPSDIERVCLNVDWLPKAQIKLLRALRRLKPDVILSGTSHMNLMALSLQRFLPSATRIIVRESTSINETFREPSYRWNPSLMSSLYRMFYPAAHKIICQSEFMIRELNTDFLIPQKKLQRIFNPVDLTTIDEACRKAPNPYAMSGPGVNIVSVGRLTFAKNFESLLHIFRNYKEIYKLSKLWILGDGPEEVSLKHKMDELGLSESVKMVGFQANPYPWLYHADLFICSSRYEGLPNALLEAIACKCPVVAADCPGGVREVMELTGNVHRLAPLGQLSIEKGHFNRAGAEESRKLLDRNFGLANIIGQYENALTLHQN